MTTLYLEPEQLQRLQELMHHTGHPLSQLVREGIESSYSSASTLPSHTRGGRPMLK